MVWVVFSIIANVRYIIPEIAAGNEAPSKIAEIIADKADLTWFDPALSEASGPYISLAYAVDGRIDGLATPTTYVIGGLNFLPSNFLPQKQQLPPIVFAKIVSRDLHLPAKDYSGFGFSFLAQAVLVLGPLFAWIPFFFMGSFFYWLSNKSQRSARGAFFAAACGTQVIQLNRSSFDVLELSLTALAATVALVILGLLGRTPQPAFPNHSWYQRAK